MHEGYIAQGILDTAVKSLPSEKAKITKVTLKVGPLTSIEPESLDYYFQELARGTPMQGAKLELIQVPAQIICKNCGNTDVYGEKHPIKITCDKCGGQNELKGGAEFYLDSMEIEE